MDSRIIPIDINNLIEKYTSGTSVKQLASDFGVSRTVITNRLINSGIVPRGRSESMYLRMSQTDIESRRKLALGANLARRGSKATESELLNKAVAYQKSMHKVGEYELDFVQSLSELGFNAIPQMAFLKYNFDIGIGNIAVEIHQCTCNPANMPYTRQRIEQVAKHGINTIYIWVKRCGVDIHACTNHIARLIQFIQSNPSVVGEYWVIRGSGELDSTSCSYSY